LNLVANGLQDVALAFEKGETGSMNVNPRPPHEGIFNRDMVEKVMVGGGMQALICLLAWHWLLGNRIPEATARNQLLLLLICMGNLQVMSCRSEKLSVFRIPFSGNWTLIAGVLFTHLLHLFATHNPLLREILSLEPVSFGVWVQTVGMALPLAAAMEIQKRVSQRRSKR
jgi:magnesium-transporting ATPase (P-type)